MSLMYLKSEAVFERLKEYVGQQRKWENILRMDIEGLEDVLGEKQLVEVFEFFKAQREEISRIPDSSAIENITIDLTAYKTSLGDLMDNKIEEIVLLLKSQVKKEVETVDAFVTEALGRISKKPSNMDEMAAKMKEFDALKEKLSAIQLKIEEIDIKNRNIKSMTGVSYNTTNMLKRW